MNPKKKIEGLKLDPDHPRLITRRDFIGHGLMSGFAISMVPSVILAMLKTDIAHAQAAACPSSAAAAGLMPLVVLDMAGGLGLASNFIVGKTGGAQDYLTSYDLLGIPDGSNPKNVSGQVETRYGAPLHLTLSRFLAGMHSVMQESTRANTKIMTVCHSSMDDSSSNQLSPLILAAKAGLVGSVLPTGLGTRSTQSGGNSTVPFPDAALKPLAVSSGTNLVNAITMGDALTGLTPAQRSRIARASSNLSKSQLSKFTSMSQGAQFKTLAECGYAKNADVVSSSSSIDASQNTHVQALYVNPANQQSEAGGANAAAVFNTLMGNVGPSAIVVGGCDYHNQGEAVSSAKDEECGRELGRILELAARLGKPVVVAGISDGAIAYEKGTRAPRSDSGSRSLAFLACFKPGGAPSLVKSQIGSYIDGQTAIRDNFFATNPAMVAYILAINYLKLSGRMDLVNSVIPSGAIPSSSLPGILGFG